MNREPSWSVITWSTICSADCAVDRPAAVGAVRMADPRPEQAQVVVDLGDRADRRARVARGRLLVDRDRRRQALDRVDVRLVHLAQELARVGRQRLDVAALALGVDRVEGEARLARAGQAGDDHEGVPRQPHVEVAEVVLARARDDELVGLIHRSSLGGGRTRSLRKLRRSRRPCVISRLAVPPHPKPHGDHDQPPPQDRSRTRPHRRRRARRQQPGPGHDRHGARASGRRHLRDAGVPEDAPRQGLPARSTSSTSRGCA